MVGVEQWAEVRRMKRVEGLSAREIGRRTGLARDTVSRLLAAEEPPRYSRPTARSGNAGATTLKWPSFQPTKPAYYSTDLDNWRLGSLPREDLPAAALDPSLSGMRTPSLARLAVWSTRAGPRLRRSVARVFAERGRAFRTTTKPLRSWPTPSRVGSIGPATGARKLGRDLAWRVNGRPARADLMPFAAPMGSSRRCRGRPPKHGELREAIVSEARAA